MNKEIQEKYKTLLLPVEFKVMLAHKFNVGIETINCNWFHKTRGQVPEKKQASVLKCLISRNELDDKIRSMNVDYYESF